MRALIFALLLTSAAFAQTGTTAVAPASGDTYLGRLLRLSEILGNLHSVRTLCEPSGDTHWRDRMMELIRLERPSTDQRNAMIEQFNTGYAAANAKFSACTDAARAYAATLAREGQSISQRLAQSVDGATTH